MHVLNDMTGKNPEYSEEEKRAEKEVIPRDSVFLLREQARHQKYNGRRKKTHFCSCSHPKCSILKRVGNKISKFIAGGREPSFLYPCIPPFQRLRTGSEHLRTSALKLCMISPVSACTLSAKTPSSA